MMRKTVLQVSLLLCILLLSTTSFANSHMGVFRDGTWYLDSNGTEGWNEGDTSITFGLKTDIPVAGDWDGNGTTDIGVFRNGWWYLDSNGTEGWNAGDTSVKFGLSTDIPVAGDWNGNGTTDMGVFRNGWWYLDSNGTQGWNEGDTSVKFGLKTDMPVAGYWDGDGTTDIGVVRNGTWYLDSNGTQGWNAGDRSIKFGMNTDTPVSGTWRRTRVNLPDTGQTACYDAWGSETGCTGTGQDGEFSINPMSFTDNGDGTVTDDVTSLMWQKCSAGQNNDATCSGSASTTMTWQGGVDYCKGLSIAGHADWRLPSKKELMSIVDYGIPDPSIDTTVFPNTYSWYYRASTEGAGNPTVYSWIVSFLNGYVASYAKTNNYSVRCVRGSSQAQSFSDNGDGTVTDNVTGLMWQKCSAGLNNDATCSGDTFSKLLWHDALAYCNGLSLAGHEDWRLPNVKELESITDDTTYDPAISTGVFPNTKTSIDSDYWSSTTYVGFPDTYAFTVYFYYSGNYFGEKAAGNHVRCVR